METKHHILLATLIVYLVWSAANELSAPARLETEAVSVITPRLRTQPRVYDLFRAWFEKHSVAYATNEELEYRFSVFADNLAHINAHNSAKHTWQMGTTKFADLTREEFAHKYLTPGYFRARKGQLLAAPDSSEQRTRSAPVSINWVEQGAVTPVQDQGTCGSCWAFASVGNLEGVNFIKEKEKDPSVAKAEPLSVQQLVDCSTPYGNFGCSGGQMDSAYEYVIDQGIETAADYPYVAYDTPCAYNSDKAIMVITQYTNIPSQQCDTLAQALQKEPISAAVDAQNWQFYKDGIFSECGKDLDHGILVVGLYDDGTSEGTGYWLIKNSFGTDWGLDGYIKLALGDTCGVCDNASYGNLD